MVEADLTTVRQDSRLGIAGSRWARDVVEADLRAARRTVARLGDAASTSLTCKDGPFHGAGRADAIRADRPAMASIPVGYLTWSTTTLVRPFLRPRLRSVERTDLGTRNISFP
jgi:hypothetical protein